MLDVTNITKVYQTEHDSVSVLRGCSFQLDASESLALVGPSGSGKSTLLSIIGTLECPTSGDIRLAETDILKLSENEKARFRHRQIGFVFQEHHLLPQCNALENVLIPCLAKGRVTSEQKNRAATLLERVGLAERKTHRPSELSGGERQRVAIARAVMMQPTLILADEPTGNLDAEFATSVADLLFELSETSMLILVTHDRQLASRAKRKLYFEKGVLHELS